MGKKSGPLAFLNKVHADYGPLWARVLYSATQHRLKMHF